MCSNHHVSVVNLVLRHIFRESTTINSVCIDRSRDNSIESIPSVFPVSEVYQLAKKYFSETPPSIIVLIDNQGFNFRVAYLARKYKIPVVYYIGPQEWIWGFKKGPQKVIKKVDKIFAVFAKEYEIYQSLTDKAEYVGHPLLDILKKVEKSEVRNKLNLSPLVIIISL